jgi:predicted outer membrane protein
MGSVFRRVTPVVAVGLALALQGMGGGAYAASSDSNGAPALTAKELVPTLHRINVLEIDAGKMAQAKGTTPSMRDYGRKLERDHQAADRHLGDYATEAKIDLNGTVPGPIAKKLQHAQNELGSLRNEVGASFDRRFAEQMVRDHKAAISLIDRSRFKIEDARLQSLLAELLPTLQSHEQIAATLLNEASGVSSKGTAAPPASAQARRPPSTR